MFGLEKEKSLTYVEVLERRNGVYSYWIQFLSVVYFRQYKTIHRKNFNQCLVPLMCCVYMIIHGSLGGNNNVSKIISAVVLILDWDYYYTDLLSHDMVINTTYYRYYPSTVTACNTL